MPLLSPMICIPRPRRMAREIGSRFVAPSVKIEVVHEVLGHYGLDLADSPRNIAGGWRNRNVVVGTSAGKKVLKRYRRKWPVSTIEHELSILGRLAELDFPSPRPNITLSDRTWINVGGWNYALYDHIEGTNYAASFLTRSRRQKLLAVAGIMLARFHRQIEGYLPMARHHLGFKSYSEGRWRGLEWYADMVPRLKELSRSVRRKEDLAHAEWLINNADQVLEEIYCLDEVFGSVRLPRLVIHGDYGIHNMLFHDDTSATLLDFELARLEWRVSDLVLVISRLGFRRSRYFLEAYQDAFPLSACEWEYLPQVWRLWTLEGAVQNWNTYFEMGAENNLAAAQDRIIKTDLFNENQGELSRLRRLVEERNGTSPQ